MMLRSAQAIPLSQVTAGCAAVMRRVGAGEGMAARLAAMGLAPGVLLRVNRNDRNGPVVIGLHGGRVMLGRGMADKVWVQIVGGATASERVGQRDPEVEVAE